MIYLDNAATTKPNEAAISAAKEAIGSFGNPSSLHRLGMDAEKIITKARETVAAKLFSEPRSIYFTSGGTESNNIAIIGSAMANMKRGRHIITSKIEHPSVLEPFKYLESIGFEVSYIGANSDGTVSVDELYNALRADTVLVSIMAVNNETGVIQPIDKIKAAIKEKSPLALLHSDCVQAFCKISLMPKKWGIDLLSLSAHKIHALKGTGALYIKDGVRVLPVIRGGGQERGLRSGTENVLGIAALSGAVSAFSPIDNKKRGELMDKILKDITGATVNGTGENSGYILNVSFSGIKSEVLLHSLEARGIFVSTGSACSSHKPQPSHVLTAMGVKRSDIDGAIRFSFCDEDFDADFVVSVLKEEVEKIRKYVR